MPTSKTQTAGSNDLNIINIIMHPEQLQSEPDEIHETSHTQSMKKFISPRFIDNKLPIDCHVPKPMTPNVVKHVRRMPNNGGSNSPIMEDFQQDTLGTVVTGQSRNVGDFLEPKKSGNIGPWP